VISAAEWAWQRQSVWSQTADKLKAGPSRARTAQLVLTVAAAALALAGSQLKGTSFAASLALGIVAAVALAGVGLLRGQTNTEQVRRWTRARSVSEAIKTEVYTFLSGEGRYEGADGENRLEAEIQRLEHEAADLAPFSRGIQPAARSLPPVHDLDSYLKYRVRDSQLRDYYDKNAKELEDHQAAEGRPDSAGPDRRGPGRRGVGRAERGRLGGGRHHRRRSGDGVRRLAAL
jgi:hypothetical protein